MLRKNVSIFAMLACLPFFMSCGGTQVSTGEGPILESNEAKALVLDQFFVSEEGLGDEFSSEGEFSVYVLDTGTDQYIVCVGADEGTEELKTPGVYYGGLDVNFREIKDKHPSSAARFRIVVVEKDSDDCPVSLDGDDDIVGQSDELTFDELTGSTVWTTNGLAAVTLRFRGDDEAAIPSMAPSLTTGLFIDKIYFDSGNDSKTQNRYYLFAEEIVDGKTSSQCQIDDSFLTPVVYGKIIYAAMGIPISCFSATDPDFNDTQFKVSLYIQRTSGPVLVGETEVTAIASAIGERVEFTNNKGYIVFQNVEATPFNASIVRLGELTDLEIDDLTFTPTPSFNATVEVHVVEGESSRPIACAGEAQGLTDVSSPDTYENMEVTLAAVSGRKELFGWDEVSIRLVEREDGLKCPEPISNDPTVLAETTTLTSSALGGRSFHFQSGGGTISFSSGASTSTEDNGSENNASDNAAQNNDVSPSENADEACN